MIRRLVVSVSSDDPDRSKIEEFIKQFSEFSEIEFFDYSIDNQYKIAFYHIICSPTFIIMEGDNIIVQSWRGTKPEAAEIWDYLLEDA